MTIFNNYKKPQFVNFIQKYPCIVWQTALNINIKSLHSHKTKSIIALTLNFSKWDKYVTTKSRSKRCYKNNVFLQGIDGNSFRSANCYSCASRSTYLKFSQHHKLLKPINQKKKLKRRLFTHPWFWWPKIFEIINWNYHCDLWFILNSRKSKKI